MDFKTGYSQSEVDEMDREKTTFIMPDSLFEFKVTPFRLCSASATLQRQICFVYFNDAVVFATNLKDHLRQLQVILFRKGISLDCGSLVHATLKISMSTFNGVHDLLFTFIVVLTIY